MLGEAKDWQTGVQSPIEDRLFIAICDVAGWMVHRRSGMRFGIAKDFAERKLEIRQMLVVPQCKIGRFRVDIAVFAKSSDGYVLATLVECDGKDFHSAPAQVARDKARDAEIKKLTNGIVVKRYTGRDIRKSAIACAEWALSDILAAQGFSALDEPTETVDRGEWWDVDEPINE